MRSASLLLAALLACACRHGAPAAPTAWPPGALVDLTHSFDDQTIYWPTGDRFVLRRDARGPQRGAEAVAKLHFPGLDPAAARWLVDQRSIHAIGLDTASIDTGQSTAFESHRILFAANVPAFENLANLEALPEQGFQVIALPMKIGGGSGGPLRIVAVVPSAGAD